jgi:hypothetical protein
MEGRSRQEVSSGKQQRTAHVATVIESRAPKEQLALKHRRSIRFTILRNFNRRTRRLK